MNSSTVKAIIPSNGITITDTSGNLTIGTTITSSAIGLSNVDNTSDLSKPISTAVQTALDAKRNTITLSAPLTWALDLLNPNQSKIALDIAGSYTMGSLSVTNNTSIVGDLYIGTASVNRNIYLNGNLFNGSITGILPDGGFSLVNSNNAMRGIVPSTGITITSDSNRLIISSTLSPTTNYTAGGLIVDNDTITYCNLYVGTQANNQQLYI